MCVCVCVVGFYDKNDREIDEWIPGGMQVRDNESLNWASDSREEKISEGIFKYKG